MPVLRISAGRRAGLGGSRERRRANPLDPVETHAGLRALRADRLLLPYDPRAALAAKPRRVDPGDIRAHLIWFRRGLVWFPARHREALSYPREFLCDQLAAHRNSRVQTGNGLIPAPTQKPIVR